MADQQSPFVVQSLRPERMGGGGGIYQLTANSVSPTRIVGVDDAGMPIEETVPAAHWRNFVANDGGINKVVLRTAAVFSMEPEAERYEHTVTREIVRAGFLPLEACPYSMDYKSVKGGPLVKVPAGQSDCGGAPHATDETNCCDHMKKVIADRRAKSRAKWDKQQAAVASMTPEAVERMQKATVEAFGQALAQHFPDPRAAKSRLRDGKGEEG